MIDLDEFRNSWNNQRINVPDGTDRRYRRSRALNDILAARYRVFTILPFALVFPCCMALSQVGIPAWLVVWYGACMSLIGLLNLNVWLSLKESDYGSMTLAEAVKRTVRIRLLMSRSQAVGIVMAVPLIGSLMWVVADNAVMLSGMACGAIVGALIGLRYHKNTMHIVKKLEKSLGGSGDCDDGFDDCGC